ADCHHLSTRAGRTGGPGRGRATPLVLQTPSAPRGGRMATERLAMHQVREILRQKLTLERSHREVMAALGVSMGVVSGVVTRAAALGLDWAAVETLDDETLEVRLYGPRISTRQARPLPDP